MVRFAKCVGVVVVLVSLAQFQGGSTRVPPDQARQIFGSGSGNCGHESVSYPEDEYSCADTCPCSVIKGSENAGDLTIKNIPCSGCAGNDNNTNGLNCG